MAAFSALLFLPRFLFSRHFPGLRPETGRSRFSICVESMPTCPASLSLQAFLTNAPCISSSTPDCENSENAREMVASDGMSRRSPSRRGGVGRNPRAGGRAATWSTGGSPRSSGTARSGCGRGPGPGVPSRRGHVAGSFPGKPVPEDGRIPSPFRKVCPDHIPGLTGSAFGCYSTFRSWRTCQAPCFGQ